LTGSLGELGVLVDLTFKVFPRKEAFATLRVDAGGLAEALEVVARLNASTEELFALELEPPGTLLLRIGGIESVLSTRIERLRSLLGLSCEQVKDEEDCWRREGEFAWASREGSLVKAPTTLAMIETLERDLPAAVSRRYGCGGSVAWICWPATEPLDALVEILSATGGAGLVLWTPEGSTFDPLLNRKDDPFERRIRSVLDGPGTFSIEPPGREE
jgi:glycolate oxidase FAD binding subunit